MRISAAAVALCVAFAADVAAARSEPRPFVRPPWGVVPSGGDASAASPPDGGDDDAEGKEDTTANWSTTSQILNSVSAGGGSPSDAHPAFVGAANKAAPATLKRPPSFGASDTTPAAASSASSLSVATNEPKTADALETSFSGVADETSAEEQIPTPRKKGPLKILFLSSDTGGGHRASAEALANQFQRLFPGTTYDLMDVWTDVDSSWPYHTIKDTYKSFSATPWKWRTLYHVSNNFIYAKFADLHSYYMNEDLIR